jgi:hypothetical protein
MATPSNWKSMFLVEKESDDQYSFHCTFKLPPACNTSPNNHCLEDPDTNVVENFVVDHQDVYKAKSSVSGRKNWTLCETSFTAFMFQFYKDNNKLPTSQDDILTGYREYLTQVLK